MNWLKQDLDSGRRDDGLTTEEHKELTLLRRENKRLKLEAEILSKAAARPLNCIQGLGDSVGF